MAVLQEQQTVPDAFWIRQAVRDDVEAMVGLLKELFAVEKDFKFNANRQRRGLELLLESPASNVWVAERSGRVVGMVSVQLVVSTAEGAMSGWLEDLVVTSAYRRRGLGNALVTTAVTWAREQGATRMQLLADGRNVPALIFYRKRDWLQTNMIALRRHA